MDIACPHAPKHMDIAHDFAMSEFDPDVSEYETITPDSDSEGAPHRSSGSSSRTNSTDSECDSVWRTKSRRETFSFAEVLYSDSRVEITPSALIVSAGGRFSRKYIDVHSVRSIWRPVYGDAFASSRPTWWQRAALGRRRPHNLVIDVQDTHLSSLPLTVAEPDAFERAISRAQAAVY